MTGTAAAVIVTGATGLVGRYLLPLLLQHGFSVQAMSRRPPPSEGTCRWHAVDLDESTRARSPGRPPPRARLGPAAVVVHAAPLWLLPRWLSTFAELGVQRLIAFSSTSRFTKEPSGDPRERKTARLLAEAEATVTRDSQARHIRWTIFRPTLIYGGGHDRNVSDIGRWLERFGFFPLSGEARGLRQPVHAADLAEACLAVLDNAATFDHVYDLPGGETLAYREMVSRVAEGTGRRAHLVQVPLLLARGILAAGRLIPRYRHLTPEMADRMNKDLVFDPSAARRDFGYDPRSFRFPGAPRAQS